LGLILPVYPHDKNVVDGKLYKQVDVDEARKYIHAIPVY
jgi:hypothetical protein